MTAEEIRVAQSHFWTAAMAAEAQNDSRRMIDRAMLAMACEIAAQLAEMNERARGDHGGPHFTKPVKE